MHATTAQRHCRRHAENVPFTHRPYWGWSHSNQRMEFMDLPSYVDSFQQGYGAAFGDLMTRMQQLGSPVAAAGASPLAAAPGQASDWRGGRHVHRHREHGHHDDEAYWGGREHRDCGCGCEHDRDRDGGCGCEHARDRDGRCGCDRGCGGCEHDHGGRHGRRRERDCRCDCCIVDADIVVFAHCGEIRVVPIEVANDSRKIRENVDVQVSDVRSGGGRVLPWPVLIQPAGLLTLQPCSTTRLELLVHIACQAESGKADAPPSDAAAGEVSPPPSSAAADALSALAQRSGSSVDVDQCEVGYITIRLDGCLVRPIVVAIAVLPLGCDSYRTGCSCSCCC